MSLQVIRLSPIPNQSTSYNLGGISYTAEVETRDGELYISVITSGKYVLRNRALRAYAPVGFGLQLVDSEGTDDPVYTGLGTRWFLMGLQA